MKPSAVYLAILAPFCFSQCVANRVATEVSGKIDSLPATLEAKADGRHDRLQGLDENHRRHLSHFTPATEQAYADAYHDGYHFGRSAAKKAARATLIHEL